MTKEWHKPARCCGGKCLKEVCAINWKSRPQTGDSCLLSEERTGGVTSLPVTPGFPRASVWVSSTVSQSFWVLISSYVFENRFEWFLHVQNALTENHPGRWSFKQVSSHFFSLPQLLQRGGGSIPKIGHIPKPPGQVCLPLSHSWDGDRLLLFAVLFASMFRGPSCNSVLSAYLECMVPNQLVLVVLDGMQTL